MVGYVGVFAPGNTWDTVVARVTAGGEADASFGAAGNRRYDFGNDANGFDQGRAIAFQQGKPVIAAVRGFTGSTDTDFYIVRLEEESAPLFRNGFE